MNRSVSTDHNTEDSTEGSTEDKIVLAPKFLAGTNSLCLWLNNECVFQTEQVQMFGRKINVPRQTAWFGDQGLSYKYSGTEHHTSGWPPVLDDVRRQLQSQCGHQSNFVLINRYLNGQHSMGWHRDDEAELAGPVLSLSLGATRRFLLDKPASESRGQSASERIVYELEHGSLLIHPRQWRHCLPKTKKIVGTRVNLSFRWVKPPSHLRAG